MSCRECGKQLDDSLHDLCRGHAYCAKGPQYFGAPCVICEDLWERSRDLDHPDEAVEAFKILKVWVHGFRKNSRKRPKGMDHFHSQQERDDFQELNAIHTNLAAILASERASSAAQPRVSKRERNISQNE